MALTSGRPSRGRRRRPLSVGLAALLVCASAMPSAWALGEDGPFDIPLDKPMIEVDGREGVTLPVTDLIADDAEPELVLSSGQLAIPSIASADQRERMRLSSDSTVLVIRGEGVWSVDGSTLSFQPEEGASGPLSGIALTFESIHGSRSLPAEFTVDSPSVITHRINAPETTTVTVDLGQDNPAVDQGMVSLTLDGMPSGTTLNESRTEMVVLDQGRWSLNRVTHRLTFEPLSRRIGGNPTPARYVVEAGAATGDEPANVLSAGNVVIETPYIQDQSRAAPYGTQILYNVGAAMSQVEPETLALVVPPGNADAVLSDDGTQLTTASGLWKLDRTEATVTFTPVRRDVVLASPIGIRGADATGNQTSVAYLRAGYPSISDSVVSGISGNPIVFRPLSNSRDVRPDTLRFSDNTLPEGATMSVDGKEVRVPGEGTWTVDTAAGTVTFSPVADADFANISPILIYGNGLYANIWTSAQLYPQYAAAIPTARDDEARVGADGTHYVDVLANDSPASPTQALEPSSVLIRSVQAVNLADLSQWQGVTLVIPREGVFQVQGDGRIAFTPAAGFVGQTTAIQYRVRDRSGLVTTGWLSFDVDPMIDSTNDTSGDFSNSLLLLEDLLPGRGGDGFAVLGLMSLLTIFAGTSSLWIGMRMESDDRETLRRISAGGASDDNGRRPGAAS